jgi:hypothetical protein
VIGITAMSEKSIGVIINGALPDFVEATCWAQVARQPASDTLALPVALSGPLIGSGSDRSSHDDTGHSVLPCMRNASECQAVWRFGLVATLSVRLGVPSAQTHVRLDHLSPIRWGESDLGVSGVEQGHTGAVGLDDVVVGIPVVDEPVAVE